MNKSLVIRNKIFRFCFLLFSFFLLLYSLFFLFNGEKGILKFYSKLNENKILKEEIIFLEIKNSTLEDKISRLSPNTLDLDYLDEQLIIQSGKTEENQIVISLD